MTCLATAASLLPGLQAGCQALACRLSIWLYRRLLCCLLACSLAGGVAHWLPDSWLVHTSHLCAYSIQKMNLNSWSVMLECTRRYSGEDCEVHVKGGLGAFTVAARRL